MNDKKIKWCSWKFAFKDSNVNTYRSTCDYFCEVSEGEKIPNICEYCNRDVFIYSKQRSHDYFNFDRYLAESVSK